MASLSDFLFGSSPKLEVQQQSTLSPEQQQLLRQLLSGASSSPDVSGSFSTSAPFPGQLTTGLSDLQGTSLAALEEAAMQRVRGPTAASTKASQTVQNAQNVDPSQLMSEFNQFFQGAVADPTIRDFQRTVLPELSRRYSGSSVFSSDRRVAETGAAQRLGETLTSGRASGFFDYLNKARDRSLTAAGMTPGLESAPITDLTSLLSAGGVPTQLKQQNIQNLYTEFLRQQQSKGTAFQQALALLGVKPFENIGAALPGTTGFLTGMAPGIGSAGTLAAAAGFGLI